MRPCSKATRAPSSSAVASSSATSPTPPTRTRYPRNYPTSACSADTAAADARRARRWRATTSPARALVSAPAWTRRVTLTTTPSKARRARPVGGTRVAISTAPPPPSRNSSSRSTITASTPPRSRGITTARWRAENSARAWWRRRCRTSGASARIRDSFPRGSADIEHPEARERHARGAVPPPHPREGANTPPTPSRAPSPPSRTPSAAAERAEERAEARATRRRRTSALWSAGVPRLRLRRARALSRHPARPTCSSRTRRRASRWCICTAAARCVRCSWRRTRFTRTWTATA